MVHMGRRLVVVAVMLLLGVPAGAQAQRRHGLRPEARRHLDRGLALYAQHRFREAVAEFQAAYQLDAEPALLYDIANAQRLSGDCPSAIPTFETFLKLAPAADVAALARANLERCRAALTPPVPVEPAEPPAASASAPAAAPAPPPPVPAAPATGASLEPASRAPTLRAPRAPAWYQDRWGDALAIGGLVATATGLLLFRSGRSDAQDANGAPTYGDYRAHGDGAEARQTVGISLLVTGGALGVAAVARYALHAGRQSPSGASVAAAPLPRGALVVLGRPF